MKRFSLTPGSIIRGVWALALVTAVCWPFLLPGTLILRDMFVPPHPALTASLFSSTSSALRALPQDAVLALAGTMMDASIFAKILFIGSALFGCWGASTLVRELAVLVSSVRSTGPTPFIGAGQLVAITLTVWNPYVVERCLQGQWSLVMAGFLLPTIALLAVRRSPWTLLFIAWAGLTPTGLILATITAVTWGVATSKRIRKPDDDFEIPRYDFLNTPPEPKSSQHRAHPQQNRSHGAKSRLNSKSKLGPKSALNSKHSQDKLELEEPAAKKQRAVGASANSGFTQVTVKERQKKARAGRLSESEESPAETSASPDWALGLRPTIMRTKLWLPLIIAFSGLVSLPWLLPALFREGHFSSSASSAAAFAARAENGVGTLGALLGLGGVWNGAVVPASRENGHWSWAGVLLGLILLSILLSTTLRLVRRPGSSFRFHFSWVISAVTFAAILLPALAAWGPGLVVMRWAITTIPGFGLFRDTQKFVIVALPGFIAAIAVLCSSVFNGIWARRRQGWRRLASRTSAESTSAGPAARSTATGPTAAGATTAGSTTTASSTTTVPTAAGPTTAGSTTAKSKPLRKKLFFSKYPEAAALTLLLCLTFANVPTAPRDVAPLQPAEIPPVWFTAASIIETTGTSTDRVLVLPPASYRELAGRPVVEPAGKLIAADVIDPGALIVNGQVQGIDNPISWDLIKTMVTGNATGEQAYVRGIRWVLVEGEVPIRERVYDSLPILSGADLVLDSPELRLYRITPHIL